MGTGQFIPCVMRTSAVVFGGVFATFMTVISNAHHIICIEYYSYKSKENFITVLSWSSKACFVWNLYEVPLCFEDLQCKMLFGDVHYDVFAFTSKK